MLLNSRRRAWKAVLAEVKTTVATWNRTLSPHDRRRIAVEDTADRILTLSTRSATLTATISLEGGEISLIQKTVSNVAPESRESIEVRVNDRGQIVLWHKGSKSSPGAVAYLILQKLGGK